MQHTHSISMSRPCSDRKSYTRQHCLYRIDLYPQLYISLEKRVPLRRDPGRYFSSWHSSSSGTIFAIPILWIRTRDEELRTLGSGSLFCGDTDFHFWWTSKHVGIVFPCYIPYPQIPMPATASYLLLLILPLSEGLCHTWCPKSICQHFGYFRGRWNLVQGVLTLK